MANFKYINPLDQPTGVFRLIDWLESNFLCDDFQHFCCLVAFAKIKPFYKISQNPIIAGKKQLKSLYINTFNSIMKIIKIDFSSI